MAVRTHYDILGLSPSASQEELKRRYRQLAMRYHPDRNHAPGANDLFIAINEAYQVLSDPLKRRQYDRRLQQIRQGYVVPQRPTRTPAPPQPQPQGARTAEPQTKFTEAYFRAKQAQARRHAAEFKPYTWPMKIVCGLWLLFGLFLSLDVLLQQERGPLPVEAVGLKVGRSFSHTQLWVSDEILALTSPWERLLAPGDLVQWHRSRWLGITLEVTLKPQGSKRRLAWLWQEMRKQPDLPSFGTPFSPKPHIYGIFSPAWILMILATLLGLALPRRFSERVFQVGLLSSFFGFFTILFLILL